MYDRVRVRDKCMIVLGSGAGSGPGLCATLPVSFRGEGGGLVEAFAPIEQPCTTLQCSLELHCNATHAVHLVCIWCASGLHVLCICHVSDVYLSRVCGVSVTYVPCIWCGHGARAADYHAVHPSPHFTPPPSVPTRSVPTYS